jgi:hypothetical protein
MPGDLPRIENKILGANKAADETRLLVVGPGVWKMSELLDEDLSGAVTEEEKDRVNCLMTEIVVPGFDWKDHQFMTETGLKDLLYGEEQKIKELKRYIK